MLFKVRAHGRKIIYLSAAIESRAKKARILSFQRILVLVEFLQKLASHAHRSMLGCYSR